MRILRLSSLFPANFPSVQHTDTHMTTCTSTHILVPPGARPSPAWWQHDGEASRKLCDISEPPGTFENPQAPRQYPRPMTPGVELQAVFFFFFLRLSGDSDGQPRLRTVSQSCFSLLWRESHTPLPSHLSFRSSPFMRREILPCLRSST